MKHFGRADGTKQKYKSVFNMLLVKNIKPRKSSLFGYYKTWKSIARKFCTWWSGNVHNWEINMYNWLFIVFQKFVVV